VSEREDRDDAREDKEDEEELYERSPVSSSSGGSKS
jgi:hypothetical protein